ncbi:transglutaminase family protein [Sporolactobacillus shoreae]|uniref:Transglutaminase family protein n=1 Tax=Sporolactobacillus shoreae TaxID=1465501 RepID=A0A4Z0GN38_9BACL|nr:transglutaminase family protein [Sporolactobacillus shoreae]TGA97717.1 transglutaminase family protein [Sporolactobacillus shoreae]
MQIIPESHLLTDYMEESSLINYSHPSIIEVGKLLFVSEQSELEKAKTAFEFVRDCIYHSWDIHHTRVTYLASDVLKWKEGICYAKSHLLAALLRSQGIPTGFCYQRLMLFDTPEKGYCIHALNAVFIKKLNRWIRLDARGNKKGVNAQFSTDHEFLAFSVQESLGEKDYPMIYYRPHPKTVATLLQNDNALNMYLHHLPSEL